MTSTEYDRRRLEALPAAQELLNDLRISFAGKNEAVWNQLDRIGYRVKAQLETEWKAYFAEPTPAPFAPKTAILKAHCEAHGIPCVDQPCVDVAYLDVDDRLEIARQLAKLFDPADYPDDDGPATARPAAALLGYHLPGGNPGARTISPGVDYVTSAPATKWYNDPATIARCLQQCDAQRIAGTISDHGINAWITPTPGGSYTVQVAQRDEARANRALALAEQEPAQ